MLGIAFKGFLLWQRSNYIDPDEGYYLLLARNLVSGNGYTINGLSNIVFPPLLPLMIAVFYFVFHNLQISLGIITAVSGGLLGFVAFKICLSRFSPRYSLFGAFLVLFIYQLNAFVPINKPYIYVLYRGSDILNTLLVLSILFLVCRLIHTKKTPYSVAAGFFASLAYLTRPEGFLLWLILVSLLIFLCAVRMARIPLKLILTFILAFMIFSLPYMFYLKKVTGRWMLSGKIAAGQEYRDVLIKVIENNDWESFNRAHYSINANLLEMNDHYFGFHATGRPDESGITLSLKKIGENLVLSRIIHKVLFPSPLLIFFVVGLIDGLIRILKKTSTYDAVLLSVFLYSFILVAMSYPIPRHHLFLVPVFCIYAVQGIRMSLSFLMKKTTKNIASMIVLSMLFFTFASDYLRYFNESVVSSKNFIASSQTDRSISEYLKSHGSRIIMSKQPGIAVRAFSDWQVLPQTDLSTLLKFALKKRVDHIVIQEESGYAFRIIEMNGSIIPDSASDKLAYQLIDSQKNFVVVRLIKPPK